VLLARERETPEVLVSDIRMPGIDGIELLHQVHQRSPDLPVIIMTAHSDLDAAVNAYQKGAFEYLPKPFDIDETLTLVERAIAHSQEQKREQASEVAEDTNAPEIIGEAPAMQEVFRAIGRLSRSSISVLINGESGTGKELVAHALHRHSPRAKKPFIALNMAAIPKDLIESELFGHEKGAFTGANSVRQGRFEQANGGTLFLDEIGDMPLDIQTRLLRVLSDGQFYRVGGHSAVKVDVRIVAATHQDLERLVHEGDFREDLFHRLNVIRIHIPALRERKQDIEKLTHHFLASAAEELGVEVKTLHPETILKLNQLNWPGNVRQLENICRWLTVMASGSEILPSDLPPELLEEKVVTTSGTGDNWQQLLANWAKCALDSGEKELLTYALPEFERILLEAALHHTNGHKQDAAKVLGWGRNTLTRKLKELY
jgi:two-component system nitrogen regulation response regulator GlnG